MLPVSSLTLIHSPTCISFGDLNNLPTVVFSTINQICLGESLDLGFVLTGTAPFTITISDNVNPPFNVIVDANGNDNTTGNPVTVTPGNIGITNYTITNISDNLSKPLPVISINLEGLSQA